MTNSETTENSPVYGPKTAYNTWFETTAKYDSISKTERKSELLWQGLDLFKQQAKKLLTNDDGTALDYANLPIDELDQNPEFLPYLQEYSWVDLVDNSAYGNGNGLSLLFRTFTTGEARRPAPVITLYPGSTDSEDKVVINPQREESFSRSAPGGRSALEFPVRRMSNIQVVRLMNWLVRDRDFV